MLNPADPQHYALAEIVFPEEAGTVVLEVDMALAADPDAAETLTSIVATAADRASAREDIQAVADELDWRVTLLPRGDTQHIRVENE